MRKVLRLGNLKLAPIYKHRTMITTMMQQSLNQDTTKAFLAGVLIPTIAYFFLLRRQQKKFEELYNEVDDDDDLFEDVNDDDEDEDDDDDDAGKDDELSSIPNMISSLKPSDWSYKHGPYKMLLIINMELSMGKGKIAAQCGHAAIGCYEKCVKLCPNAVRAWYHSGCAKIALKCNNTNELLELMQQAKNKYRIPHYLVEDAGKTQIAAGSRTVLGLFAPTFYFDHDFTNHLKLM
jgi:peptidyl-tRNA hydrolase, PTH2 family